MNSKPNQKKAFWAVGILLFCSTLAGAVSFTPGELIVKLRERPTRGALDEITRTGAPALDAILQTTPAILSEPLAEFRSRYEETDRILKVNLTADQNLDSLEAVLSGDAQIEWVTRNYHYRTVGSPLDYIPNDSLFADAWWLEKISAPLAWDITRGDSSLVIGVIDTGVDYLHPDLAGNIWHNWADSDSDGIDDDDNGFIDDAIGWDFVDAPAFPAGGDYLERDNDPMDELGHGTYVSGIACAVSDNETCYASIGFNCRVMCLRAGNINGLLEEDDAAAAILYAAANGAQVINMSFGDVVASPLLQEACRLAYEQGVVLVASAGNAASQSIHYPSGFPEVISVGATNQIDQRASFSNYGPSVDLMAPGSDIVSTIQGGECGEWDYPSGTSYAAPMVGATALLMLSVNSALTPADVLDVVRTSADDIRMPGWDDQTTHGRLNVRRAVEMASYGSDLVARITAPYNDTGVTEDFAVFGEAWGAAFESYEVMVGLGENPQTWTTIASGDERRYGDSLGVVSVPEADTVLIVRLEVQGTDGFYSIDHTHLYVQRNAPPLDSLAITRMLDRDSYADLVHVWAGQTSSAAMLLTNTTGDSLREDFGYVAEEHVSLLSSARYPGPWDVRVRLENLAGLETFSDPFEFHINSPSFSSNEWINEPTDLPHGVLGNFRTDYDCDGMPEVWLLPIQSNGLLDTLRIWEWNGSGFGDTGNRYGLHLPQAVGDADQDGRLEIMARRFSETRIWEQSESCGVPDSVVFESIDSWDEFLGSDYLDLNPDDDHGELIARVGIESLGSRYIVYSVGTDYQLTVVDTLPNLSEGSNSLGPPSVIMKDLDGDGLFDFLYGDYDGDLIFCEYDGSEIQQRWTTRLPLNDATDWGGAGDLDGDGMIEFVAGSRSNSNGGTESQRRSRHWEYFIFENVADNEFVITDSVFILGNENISDHPASIEIGDVDADLQDDILISAFPDQYIISFDAVSGQFTPRWYASPSQSNTNLIADFDADGINEFYYSDGSWFHRVEAASAAGERPPPPLSLTGEPTGETSIALRWSAVADADSYLVYRSSNDRDFAVLSAAQDTQAAYSDVQVNTLFYYAVATVSDLYPTSISVMSNSVAVTANAAPAVEDTAEFIEPRFVKVTFSESMGPSSLIQGSYALDDQRMPAVISPAEGGRVVYLTFDGSFASRWYSLVLRNLRDAQNSRLSDTEVVFGITRTSNDPPRILSHRLAGEVSTNEVEVTYSQPMSVTALDPDNYRMDYGRAGTPAQAEEITPLTADNRQVQVHLPAGYPVGATGLSARMLIRGVENTAGVAIDTSSGRADLLLSGMASNLDEAYVFPNPYRGLGAGAMEGVNFAGLPETATIRIYTIRGVLLKEIEYSGFTGAVTWDLRNDRQDKIGSGIYLYVIESGGEEVRGKLAVMR